MKLKALESKVRKCLKNYPETRGSDDLLYIEVIKEMGIFLGQYTADYWFRNYRKMGLPSIESVGRCRRKIQEKNEALKPIKEIELQRRAQEKTFYNYSLGF